MRIATISILLALSVAVPASARTGELAAGADAMAS
jgi:hypothetical protein